MRLLVSILTACLLPQLTNSEVFSSVADMQVVVDLGQHIKYFSDQQFHDSFILTVTILIRERMFAGSVPAGEEPGQHSP